MLFSKFILMLFSHSLQGSVLCNILNSKYGIDVSLVVINGILKIAIPKNVVFMFKIEVV